MLEKFDTKAVRVPKVEEQTAAYHHPRLAFGIFTVHDELLVVELVPLIDADGTRPWPVAFGADSCSLAMLSEPRTGYGGWFVVLGVSDKTALEARGIEVDIEVAFINGALRLD